MNIQVEQTLELPDHEKKLFNESINQIMELEAIDEELNTKKGTKARKKALDTYFLGVMANAKVNCIPIGPNKYIVCATKPDLGKVNNKTLETCMGAFVCRDVNQFYGSKLNKIFMEMKLDQELALKVVHVSMITPDEAEQLKSRFIQTISEFKKAETKTKKYIKVVSGVENILSLPDIRMLVKDDQNNLTIQKPTFGY
jgi:hypothetical protein